MASLPVPGAGLSPSCFRSSRTTPAGRTPPTPLSLTSGTRQVFKVDVPAASSEVARRRWRRWRPKLWWVLECSFMPFMVLLTLVVILLWWRNNEKATARLAAQNTRVLETYRVICHNATTELAEAMQMKSSSLVKQLVVEYLEWPGLIVNLRSDDFLGEMGDPTPRENLSRNLFEMWQELRHRFVYATSVSYADQTGLYLGYERLPEYWLTFDFGAAYRPADGDSQPDRICPQMCDQNYQPLPPDKGSLAYYYVNRETGRFLHKYNELPYDPRNRTWYGNAVVANGSTAWTGLDKTWSGTHITVTASKAVVTRDGTLAVIRSTIGLEFMSQFLRAATVWNKKIFIIDRLGRMIASSGGIQEVFSDTTRLTMFDWSETGDATIEAVVENLKELHNNSLAEVSELGFGYVSVGEANRADSRHIYTWSAEWDDQLTHKNISYVMERGHSVWLESEWILICVQDTAAYLGEVQAKDEELRENLTLEEAEMNRDLAEKSFITLLLCIGFTCLSSVLMAVVARCITRPLKYFSKDMQSLARLEFMEAGLEVETRDITRGHARVWPSLLTRKYKKFLSMSTIREIDQMRDSFAQMANGLQSFSRYMDISVVQILLKSRQSATLGVAKAEVTIFFSDVAGFTTIAESLRAEQFHHLFAEYLDAMSCVIMQYQGIVGEFIGDSIMAWWNSPVELGDRHTKYALYAALEQQLQLAELRRKWMSQGFPEVRARMGLARGNVLVGNIGSTERMKYGLVGDSVNLASRLEGLCKMYKVDIIVDDAARNAPGVAETFLLRPLDLVTVKGRTGATELYELVGLRPHSQSLSPGKAVFGRAVSSEPYSHFSRAVSGEAHFCSTAATEAMHSDSEEDVCCKFELAAMFVEAFTEIQRLYRGGEFRAAVEALKEFQQRWPSDRPAQIIRERCEAMLLEGPAAIETWDPVQKLTQK